MGERMAALGPAHYTSSLVFACFLTRSAIYEFRPGFAWRLTRLWHLITGYLTWRLALLRTTLNSHSYLPSCLPVFLSVQAGPC
jgi:CHASE2 domain-containing sensor protein